MNRRSTHKRSYKRKSRKFNFPIVCIALSLFIFLLTQMVYLSLFGTKGKEISHIGSQKVQLSQQIKDIEGEISNLRSLASLEESASEDLGLTRSSDIRYIVPGYYYSSTLDVETNVQ